MCICAIGSFAHLYEKRGKSKSIGFGTIDDNNIDNLPESITEEKIFDLLPAELQGRIEKTVILQCLSEDNYNGKNTKFQLVPVDELRELQRKVDMLIQGIIE